jgi:phosphoribosylformylglycinamidine cyclo-ligase
MNNSGKNKTTYSDAGVNIDAGYALVNRIKPFAKATDRAGIMGGIGGFGGLFDLKAAGYDDAVLVAATDGVGTKLKLAQATNNHKTIGIDLVAMCVNDLLAQAAEPLFFLDYFACGALEVETAAEVIAGIAEGCKLAGCALIGGETAEMPSMYQTGEYDLAGFAVGAAPRDELLPNKLAMVAGDVLIGLASSGVHSNGYSLVRRLIDDSGLSYLSPTPWDMGETFGEAFIIPTRIYVQSVLPLMRSDAGIKGFAHITGGGLTENLPRILPSELCAVVDCSTWIAPSMFEWLAQTGGLNDAEMLNTFNCGIGAVLAVEANIAEEVMHKLQKSGEKVWQIGELVQRTDEEIIYNGSLQYA